MDNAPNDYPIKLGRLDPSQDWEQFDAGDSDLNEFIKEDAARLEAVDVTRVHVALAERKPVGYIAILADTVVLQTGERKKLDLKHADSKNIPALKVGRLAVDREAKKVLSGVGKTLMWLAYQYAVGARKTVGCRLLTVDAYAQTVDGRVAVDYYAGLGFEKNKAAARAMEMCRVCGEPLDRCPHCQRIFPVSQQKTVSMRFDLKIDPLPEWAIKPLGRRLVPGAG